MVAGLRVADTSARRLGNGVAIMAKPLSVASTVMKTCTRGLIRRKIRGTGLASLGIHTSLLGSGTTGHITLTGTTTALSLDAFQGSTQSFLVHFLHGLYRNNLSLVHSVLDLAAKRRGNGLKMMAA